MFSRSFSSLRLNKSATDLDESYSDLTTFPNLTNGVLSVQLAGNRISSLPNLSKYTCLRKVDLSGNKLQDIHNIGDLQHLEELDISYNKISACPHALFKCNTLKILKLNNNILDELPFSIGKLYRLETLLVDHNPLRKLPAGILISYTIAKLTSLHKLSATHTLLVRLPDPLPSCLNDLVISHNPIRSLPELPASLTEITATNMLLDTLPKFPLSLRTADFSHNSISFVQIEFNEDSTIDTSHSPKLEEWEENDMRQMKQNRQKHPMPRTVKTPVNRVVDPPSIVAPSLNFSATELSFYQASLPQTGATSTMEKFHTLELESDTLASSNYHYKSSPELSVVARQRISELSSQVPPPITPRQLLVKEAPPGNIGPKISKRDRPLVSSLKAHSTNTLAQLPHLSPTDEIASHTTQPQFPSKQTLSLLSSYQSDRPPQWTYFPEPPKVPPPISSQYSDSTPIAKQVKPSLTMLRLNSNPINRIARRTLQEYSQVLELEWRDFHTRFIHILERQSVAAPSTVGMISNDLDLDLIIQQMDKRKMIIAD